MTFISNRPHTFTHSIPQGFNDQLQKTAFQLAALGHAHQLDEDWDVVDRQMRWAQRLQRTGGQDVGVVLLCAASLYGSC